MSNIIFLEYLDKKNFPPGEWCREPDLSYWDRYDMSCLTLRDMSLGIWRGFVGVEEQHPFYKKSINKILQTKEASEILFQVHGGVCSSGRLPVKYKKYASDLWWVGITTSHDEDYMPLVKLEFEDHEMFGDQFQTYKNFSFIRKETNKLAKFLSKMK